MVIERFTLKIWTVVLVLALLVATSPSFAGWVYSSGDSSGDAWFICDGGASLFWSWSSGTGSPCYHNGLCYPHGGIVSVKGSITRTLTWEGGDPPQTPVLIREIAGAGATSTDGGVCFVGNSLGPQGDQSVVRYTWVDGSSGTISRTISMSATASNGEYGRSTVSITYTSLDVVASYPGATVDRTYAEPPRYVSSQPYSNRPCFSHNNGAVASGNDPVNLATGEHLYIPAPDLSVYNPYGPTVVYQRNFFSKLAKDGSSSPGLPVGWIDGFDARIVLNDPAQQATWKDLKLVYPNSAVDGPFLPVLNGGNPTGEFSEPTGNEYIVTGVTSATPGQWDSITITYKDRTKWVFLPAATYDYWLLGNPARPHIKSVSVPSPTGSGTSTESYAYDSEVRVSSVTDANENVEEYYYECPDATRVKTKNAQGTVEDERLVIFDPANGNVMIGTADKKGNNTATLYDDSNNSKWPTKVIDQINRATEITYDQFGNILTVKRPRGTVTTYTYDYNVFSLGRLMSIQEYGKTATTLTYYEPSGLVETITGPKPGATDSSTVTTTFTYDSLGNILTVVAPGNNADTSIVTTYNYTTDGEYTQSAKLGQPLTVTDNLGHVTHFRYDARGNIMSSKDALGNETNFIFNIADQLSTLIEPTIGP